jgi:hypothetical protein
MADSATQGHPHGGFRHSATKIVVGAPIAGACSQAKRTTTKLKDLNIPDENKFTKKIDMLSAG